MDYVVAIKKLSRLFDTVKKILGFRLGPALKLLIPGNLKNLKSSSASFRFPKIKNSGKGMTDSAKIS